MRTKDLIYFFIGVVLPTYDLLRRIGNLFGKRLKRLLVRTEREVIFYTHYKMRTIGRGHHEKHPMFCHDGECRRI